MRLSHQGPCTMSQPCSSTSSFVRPVATRLQPAAARCGASRNSSHTHAFTFLCWSFYAISSASLGRSARLASPPITSVFRGERDEHAMHLRQRPPPTALPTAAALAGRNGLLFCGAACWPAAMASWRVPGQAARVAAARRSCKVDRPGQPRGHPPRAPAAAASACHQGSSPALHQPRPAPSSAAMGSDLQVSRALAEMRGQALHALLTPHAPHRGYTPRLPCHAMPRVHANPLPRGTHARSHTRARTQDGAPAPVAWRGQAGDPRGAAGAAPDHAGQPAQGVSGPAARGAAAGGRLAGVRAAGQG